MRKKYHRRHSKRSPYKPKGGRGNYRPRHAEHPLVRKLNYVFMAIGIILGILYLLGYR